MSDFVHRPEFPSAQENQRSQTTSGTPLGTNLWGRTHHHVTVRARACVLTTAGSGLLAMFNPELVAQLIAIRSWCSVVQGQGQPLSHFTWWQQPPWYIYLCFQHLLNCDNWAQVNAQLNTVLSLPLLLGASFISSKRLFHAVLLMCTCE